MKNIHSFKLQDKLEKRVVLCMVISEDIQLFQSKIWQLNSVCLHYLGTTILIDPGFLPDEILQIQNVTNTFVGDDKFLLYTHGDFDHIVGVHSFDSFQQIGSFRMQNRLDRQKIVNQWKDFDQNHYVQRSTSYSYPILDHVLDIETMAKSNLGNIEVHSFKARGHTEDGLFYVFPSLKLFVAGDYLSDIEFPFIEDSLEEYFKTLVIAKSIIQQYDIQFLIPGHGSIAFTQPDIIQRIDSSQQYLESLSSPTVKDWTLSWGHSPFHSYLNTMHQKNISYVRAQGL